MSSILDQSFLDLSDGEQWDYLRACAQDHLRSLWQHRHTPPIENPYVHPRCVQSMLREQVAYLRQLDTRCDVIGVAA